MMPCFPLIWIIALVASLLAAQPAAADIYSFVDERGVVHFSNVPNDPRFRPYITSPPLRRPGRGPVTIDNHIESAATLYKVDPHLVRAVIKAESGFNNRAYSNKGAMGLMQLMPNTARDMDVADPYDPGDNIHGGTRYLKKLLGLFNNDLILTLAAYNAGPSLVRQVGQVPDIAETQEYIRRVLFYYRNYKTSHFL